jgi:hypothetical protein
MAASIARQAEIAVGMADVVVLVVDARVGALDEDEAVVKVLRKSGKPVLLAANKVDDARAESDATALWNLGLGEPWPVSALHGRGSGDMLDAIVALQMQEFSVHTVGGKPQQRSQEPHAHVYIRAPYGVFASSDGYLALAFPPLGKLAAIIDAPLLATMNDQTDTFTRRDEIFAITRDRLKTQTNGHWLTAFDAQDIWAAPVLGYADVLADPQIAHNGTFVEYEHPTEGRVKTPGFPIRFSKTPSRVERGAPITGQHSRELLRELGLSDAQITELIERKVIGEQTL